eukprot:4849984-Pyramimonas_sp.AAC.1
MRVVGAFPLAQPPPRAVHERTGAPRPSGPSPAGLASSSTGSGEFEVFGGQAEIKILAYKSNAWSTGLKHLE